MVQIISYLWILPLLYVLLYIGWSAIKSINPLTNKLIFCPVCATFFSVLLLGFILDINHLILSFLLGLTMTGIAMKIHQTLKDKDKKYFAQLFFLELFFTFIGLLIVIFYLSKGI